MESDHSIEINRNFTRPKEETLLRLGEAVYPAKQKSWMAFPSLPFLPEKAVNSDDPEWWNLWYPGPGEPGSAPIPYAVTTAAVRYYYDLSLKLRRNPWEEDHSTRVYSSRLRYNAKIEHQQQWSHRDQDFTDVYVITMEMRWEAVCGNVCGLFFSRKKLVVVDSGGNVRALIIEPSDNPPYSIS